MARRVRRYALRAVMVGALLVAALVVWLLWFFPNGLAVGVARDAAADMGLDLRIGALDLRPLEGMRVQGIEIDAPANRALDLPPLVSVGEIEVRWALRESIRRGRVQVTSIEIADPQLSLRKADGVWNAQRVLDALAPPAAPGASPAPSPTPAAPPLPLEEQIAVQIATVDSMLAMVPIGVDLDRLHVSGAGAEIATEAATLARVEGFAATVSLHLSTGGAAVEVALDPEPGITVALQPGGGTQFSGTIHPRTRATIDLPRSARFDAEVSLSDARLLTAGVELPLALAVKASGTADIPAGDLRVLAETIDLGFLEATASLEVDGLGLRGIRASWAGGVSAAELPSFVTQSLLDATRASHLHAGGRVKGSLEGRLETVDPAVLQASIAKGRLPLTLSLRSEGTTDDDVIALDGIALGRLSHRASVEVTPERIAVDGGVEITRVRIPPVLAGRPFTLAVENRLSVPATLDAVTIERALVSVPDGGIRVEGAGRVAGLLAALDAWSAAGARGGGTLPAALAAVTALRDVDLRGGFRFSSDEEIEVADGAFLRGTIDAKGSFSRRADPYGRLKAEVVYQDFGARVAGAAPPVKKGSVPTIRKAGPPPDALRIERMNARLVMDRELILGGTIASPAADVEKDIAEVFDPATRGYYDRLGSLRAETDNVRIARVFAPPLDIRELSAEVLYDGAAVHVNRGRMQLLGGEVVGRAILRPTAEGLHVALAGDVSGIDMSPLLLERPVGDPNDTRVHMSSAASFFLSKDDPIGSLADARMRLDVTAAGSKVLDTLLAWLDPEYKDPMFNWARSVNKKVVGLTRPRFSAVADRGMYDVTIGFPSLGLEKDVQRIPLRPLLDLRFTREVVGGLAPPGDLLPLLAARGIDGNGRWVLPETAAEPP